MWRRLQHYDTPHISVIVPDTPIVIDATLRLRVFAERVLDTLSDAVISTRSEIERTPGNERGIAEAVHRVYGDDNEAHAGR